MGARRIDLALSVHQDRMSILGRLHRRHLADTKMVPPLPLPQRRNIEVASRLSFPIGTLARFRVPATASMLRLNS